MEIWCHLLGDKKTKILQFCVTKALSIHSIQSHPIIIRSDERLAQTKLTQRARCTCVCRYPPRPARGPGQGEIQPLAVNEALGIRREDTSTGYRHRDAGNEIVPLRKSLKGSPRFGAELRKGSGCHVTAVFAGYTELGVWYTRPWKAQCSMGYQNSGATSA